MEPASSTRFDRYEILAPLGAGGMGEVVKARALGPHGFEKIVAIKRIRAEWATQEAMAERFIREARIAARVQHANIVSVFDFGRHHDELFIVMEHIDGQSLDDVLLQMKRRNERPTLSQALQITLDVARALDSAHTLTDDEGEPVGIVHRDVSPANILVSRQGVVKLTDFGIAAWTSTEGRTSLVAGKPLYMAPEQLRGDALDGRADLFAVGVVLYEMLTGRRPWKGLVDPTEGATLESMGYEPASTWTTGQPAEIDALVERLLEPSLERRMGSAKELVKAIVQLSYKLQIVLDPSELAGLVGEAVDHALSPTLPHYESKPETLITRGVSPDGVTLLATEDEPLAPAPTPERPAEDPPRVPWLLVAAGALVAVGALAVWAASGDPSAAPVATTTVVADETPRGDAPPEAPEDEPSIAAPSEPETAPEASPEVPIEAPVEAPVEAEARPARPRERTRRGGDETPTRAAAPAGEPGELDVFSRPWAEIYIDGERQSVNAPARGLRVASGRRRVRLVNPVLGLSEERTVVVPPGGRVQLRVFLEPSGEASADPAGG